METGIGFSVDFVTHFLRLSSSDHGFESPQCDFDISEIAVMVKALIGLGANLGNPTENLNAAKSELAALRCTKLVGASDWVATVPIGGPSGQGGYVNGAVVIETELTPTELFAEIQRIEYDLGRQRTVRWGPRRIDLDILLYADETVDLAELTIPHPWMAIRRFVLEPASQVASEMVHPRIEWNIGRIFDNLRQQPGRFEITSLPGIDTATVATWLAGQVDGVADCAPQSGWGLTPGSSLAEALELVDDFRVGPTQPPNSTKTTIGNRWPGELLVAGRIYLGEDDFDHFAKAWSAAHEANRTPSRKLLLVLTDSSKESAAEKYDPDETGGLPGAQDDLAIEFWQYVERPGCGPWLVVDINDPEKMQHDLVAAVTGMR